MASIGTARRFVKSVGSKFRSFRGAKPRRHRERQGPLFEILEPRLYLSASAAAFATSALADYGPKPPMLMMPLTAGRTSNASATTVAPVISQVAINYLAVPGGNWSLAIFGSGFGNQPAFNGTSDYILVTDVPLNGSSTWGAGYGGDWVWIDVTRWTNNEIDISKFTGSYTEYNWTINTGDSLSIVVANPMGGPESNIFSLTVPVATPAAEPNITSVDTVPSGTSSWNFSVSGSDLGTAPAASASDSSYLNLVDVTQHFSIGYIGSPVPVRVSSWTNTGMSISISSVGTYTVGAGDDMTLAVVNPQTGVISNQYQFTMPAAAPAANSPVISGVAMQPLAGAADNWTITITGSNFGTNTTPLSTSPDLLILDTTNNVPAGNTGDTVTANVTSWTDSQIVIQGCGGQYGQPGLAINSGDKLTVTITNPQTGEQGTSDVTVPAASAPAISSVSFQQTNGDWIMTVVGSGFGTQSAFTDNTTPYLQISDTTDGQNAGYSGDLANVTVTSWTDTSIVVTGFVGDNTGLKLVVINPGDAVSVTVWNAQADVESSAYSTTVPNSPNSPPSTDTKVAVSVSEDGNDTWTVGFSAGNFSTTYTIDAQLLQGILQAAQTAQDIESLLGDVPGFHIQTSIQDAPTLGFSLSGDLYFSPTGKLDAISLTDGVSVSGVGATIEGYFGLSFLNVGVGIEATAAAGVNGTVSLIDGNLVLSEGGYLSGTLQGFAEATVALWEGKAYVQGTLTASVAVSSSGYASAALTASGQVGVEVDSVPLFGGSPSPIWNDSYSLGSYPLGQWNFSIKTLVQGIINDATVAFDSYLGKPQASSVLAAAPLLAASGMGSTSSMTSSELTLPLAGNTDSLTVDPTLDMRQAGIVVTNNTTHSSTGGRTSYTAVGYSGVELAMAGANENATLSFANFASAPSVQASGVGFGNWDVGLLPNILESPLTVGSFWVA